MPPLASYQLVPVKDNDKEKLSPTFAPFLKESFIHFSPSDTEVTVATTRKGSKIAIVYRHLNPSTKLALLLSHGNAADLGSMINFMHELGSKLGVNMRCYDYSGYGASTGKPLEKNLYADAECALSVWKTKFSVPPGSDNSLRTEYRHCTNRVAAVALHSPLMSGLRVSFPRLKRDYRGDVFSNVVCAPRIVSPALVIHGILVDETERSNIQSDPGPKAVIFFLRNHDVAIAASSVPEIWYLLKRVAAACQTQMHMLQLMGEINVLAELKET
ncbi:unnamed protein product [Calicophoron daubneyi]|uniref:Uncharacterized protein n=1 Tax=Calicophoron daubneyi TaxID=300641 RepID=A0AAV2T291_CALDB